MTQYYVFEIKQLANGEYEHQAHWAWDEDPNKARLKAESKYHEIMSAAAVSETKKHSAVVLSDECFALMQQCYRHNVVPAPESEPEEEYVPEPEDNVESEEEAQEDESGEPEAPDAADESEEEVNDPESEAEADGEGN